MIIDWYYQIIILSGLVIISALAYMKYYSTRFFEVVTEIIKMNELYEYDPVMFIENLQPYMKLMSVRDYGYYISYLEEEYKKDVKSTNKSIKKFIYTKDFTIFVEIVPGRIRWERTYITTLLANTVFLLIKSDVSQHLKSISKAFDETNKLNTFIQHDVKNFAQFINLLNYNTKRAKTDEENSKIVEHLKASLPSLQMRSDRVMATLEKVDGEYFPEITEFNPLKLAKKLAPVFNVEIKSMSGFEEKISADKHGFTVIYENIIKNFYDKSLVEKGIELYIDISLEEDMLTVTFTDTGSPIGNPEKVFAPFFTTKKSGLGVGLFHCRNIAKEMKAELIAENIDNRPTFKLRSKVSKIG